MTPRSSAPYKAAPDAIKAVMAVQASIEASGLEPALLELVKLRASQINVPRRSTGAPSASICM